MPRKVASPAVVAPLTHYDDEPNTSPAHLEEEPPSHLEEGSGGGGLQDVFAPCLSAHLLPAEGQSLAQRLSELPPRPGCYLFYDSRDELLYVGKAISLRNRVRSYFHKDQSRAPKIRRLVKRIHRIEYRETPTELHALTLECRLIKSHQPHFNALLKGDKRLASLRVTVEETFPRVFMDWEAPNGVSRYYGPFSRREATEDLLDVLYRVFRLRSCDKAFTGLEGLRPCLYYDMDQCLAPCNAAICSQQEYAKAVADAMDFLDGLQDSLVERLETEMNDAAESLLFERAARLRDLRAAVLKWMERQNFLAVWRESTTGAAHLFCVRFGQLAGHCHVPGDELETDNPAWRLTVMKTLQETYATPLAPHPMLGPVAIEELNIMEGWLTRKRAARACVVPPRSPNDSEALHRMMHQVEGGLDQISRLSQA